MEYIIHLTDNCNLNCSYCYQHKINRSISFENIKNLIDYEITRNEAYSIIYFYGGEPLLEKELIKDTINYINSKKCKTSFYYGITTNGTLLDEAFIKYMKKNNFISIAYSIDGASETQNLNRKTFDGNETFNIVSDNFKKLLHYFDNISTMTVITKNNLSCLSKNVEYLINMNFKCINLLFDYSQTWQDNDLIELRNQYSKIAKIYADNLLHKKDITIPIIDDKIQTYIYDEYNCNDNCSLGIKTINVGTDGFFYPCMQFVYNKDFIIGNCKSGIDIEKRAKLIQNSKKEQISCSNCTIKKRCKHLCSCKNYKLTNDINKLSPIICETEKLSSKKLIKWLHIYIIKIKKYL